LAGGARTLQAISIFEFVARGVAFACLDEKRLSPAALAFWKVARSEARPD
jgi:hypothetical protein